MPGIKQPRPHWREQRHAQQRHDGEQDHLLRNRQLQIVREQDDQLAADHQVAGSIQRQPGHEPPVIRIRAQHFAQHLETEHFGASAPLCSACRSRNDCRTRMRRYNQAASNPARSAATMYRPPEVYRGCVCSTNPASAAVRAAMPIEVAAAMRPVMRASTLRG